MLGFLFFRNITNIAHQLKSRIVNTYEVFTNRYDKYQIVKLTFNVTKKNGYNNCPLTIFLSGHEQATAVDENEFK